MDKPKHPIVTRPWAKNPRGSAGGFQAPVQSRMPVPAQRRRETFERIPHRKGR